MLSFIIIGKNEGWKLSLCLEKVFETIRYNNLTSYEVIYVDSKSTDDTYERVKKYEEVKFVALTADCNPAIARNVGAEVSTGDVLFFLDGDMELIPDAFDRIYSEGKALEHPFISGNFENYNYDQNWDYKDKNVALKLYGDTFSSHVGGLFFIEKQLWESVGGMRNVFRKGQDNDLSLRLARKGIKLLRKDMLLVHHHMIPYLDKKRKWKMLFDGSQLYARPLLYRKNILNRYCLNRMIRNDYTALSFLLSAVGSVLMGPSAFLLYFCFVFLRALSKKKEVLSNFVMFILRDLEVILGFVFFYPRKLTISSLVLN